MRFRWWGLEIGRSIPLASPARTNREGVLNTRRTGREIPSIGQLRQASAQARTRVAERPPRTAFVLSGGGNQAVSQVGMLQALLERDVVPDVVVGTSAGAWN